MFSNVGKVIKGIAKTIFVIFLLIGIVSGITVGVLLSDSGVDDVLSVFTCFGLIVVFSFLSYISVIFLYAFGSIVDDLKEIRSKLCTENIIREVPRPQPKPEVKPIEEPVQKPVVSQLPKEDSEFRSPSGHEWICPVCGNKNGEGIFCTRCGNKKN